MESEIKRKVYERFPKLEEERHCALTRRLLKEAREAYAKKLESEQNHISTEAPQTGEQV